MAPMVIAYARDVHDVNDSNLAKLDQFIVINKCGDHVTKVDQIAIQSEIELANDIIHSVSLIAWICMTMWLLQFFCVCFIPLLKCILDACDVNMNSDDDFYGSSKIEMVEAAEEKPKEEPVDAEAEFLKRMRKENDQTWASVMGPPKTDTSKKEVFGMQAAV